MKKAINVLSLFDGMSGAQIALGRAGIKVNKYFASEVDKFAMAVTNYRYPETIQLGDVRGIKADDIPGPRIDLLIGGSPCQGFSFAGKQLNFEDERSKLFFQYVRILKEVKPKFFVLENVYMKDEYKNVISEHLGVDPVFIDSKIVSAQNRKRYYWANFAISQPENKHILFNDILDNAESERGKSVCIDANYYRTSNSNPQLYLWKARRQIVFEKPHGYNKGGISAKEKFNTLRACTRDNYLIQTPDLKWRKLNVNEVERLQTVDDNYTLVPYKNRMMSNTQRYKMLGNGFTIDVIAHILKCMKESEK